MLNDNAKAVIDKLQYIIDRFVKVKFYPTPRKIVNEPHVIEKQSDDTYISFFGEIVSDKEKYEVRVFKETTLEQSFPDFNEYTLVKTMPTKANECYVDRENNLIYFHSSQDTSEISITYYSIGIGMLSSALVYTHFDSNNKVIETLYSLTKKCQEELDRISTVTNAEQLRVELQSYIESLLELIRLYPNPGVVVAELTNLINQANESSLELKTTIGEAELFLEQIKAGSNKFVIITPKDWVKVEEGKYKYDYWHNLNTTNLNITTTQLLNGIETSCAIDYEKPLNNKMVLYTSDNTITVKVVVGASYYPGILGNTDIGVISADHLEDGVEKVVMNIDERNRLKTINQEVTTLNSKLESANTKITQNQSNIETISSQMEQKANKTDFSVYNDNIAFLENLKKRYLFLSNRNYVLNKDMLLTTNKLHLKGNDSVIQGNYNFIVRNNDVCIENVTFDGLASINFTGCQKVVLKNCTIKNNTKFGLVCSECENVEIRNCTFLDNGKNVVFENSSGAGFSILGNKVKVLKIYNCYFEGSRGQSAIRCKEVEYSEIRFNRFNDNFFRAIEYSSLDGGFSYDYKGDASYNYIIDCGKRNNNPTWDEATNGIFGNACLHSLDLIGNTIINSRENAIEGRFNRVKDNYINGTGVGDRNTTAIAGVSASSRYIENNTFVNCKGFGLSSGGSCEYTTDCNIINNTFENCQGGLLLHFTQQPNLKNLLVANNIAKKIPCIKIINNYPPSSYEETVSNIIFCNNKGGKFQTDNKVTIEHNDFKILDKATKLIKNNKFINYNADTNKPNNFYFINEKSVNREVVDDSVVLTINGTPYNTFINHDFEIDSVDNALFNFKISYLASHVKIKIYEKQLDGSMLRVYEIEDSNLTDSFKTLNYTVRPFSELKTGSLSMQLTTKDSVIKYKEIGLNCYNL